MNILVDDEVISVREIRLNADATAFELFADAEHIDDTPIIEVENVLEVPTTDWPLHDYRVALFTHSGWPESNVLSLIEKEERAGVLFSLECLASEDCALNETDSLRAFGFIALQKLCLGEQLTAQTNAYLPTKSRIKITELLPQDTMVAIFDIKSILRVSEAPLDLNYINDRLASFAKYGFYLENSENASNEGRGFKANAIAMSSDRKNLKMRRFSADLPLGSKEFLISTFLTTAPYEREPGFRFFLAYQVFESLIQDLYGKLLQDFVSRAQGMNSTELKNLIEKLSSSIKEKNRLREIVQACRGINDDANDLMRKCNAILQKSGVGPEKSIEMALYGVRNLLFHRFAEAMSLRKELNEVAESLFVTVCELAIQYTAPKPKL